jgi:hypothetical protein
MKINTTIETESQADIELLTDFLMKLSGAKKELPSPEEIDRIKVNIEESIETAKSPDMIPTLEEDPDPTAAWGSVKKKPSEPKESVEEDPNAEIDMVKQIMEVSPEEAVEAVKKPESKPPTKSGSRRKRTPVPKEKSPEEPEMLNILTEEDEEVQPPPDPKPQKRRPAVNSEEEHAKKVDALPTGGATSQDKLHDLWSDFDQDYRSEEENELASAPTAVAEDEEEEEIHLEE